ncbi:MAG: ABC transporter ATP-binding protein [Bacteroidota bacterium]|nr:ABC transporter ATP-binding protein [Bacteroidota bacterium]
MKTTAISVSHLVKEYHGKNEIPLRALDDISFDVQQGQIFGLLGPNGAGKSTAIKILTTLIPPTSGTVTVNGCNVVSQPLEVRKNICVVLQENAVDSFITVRQNFLTFGRFHGLTKMEIEMRVEHVVEMFGLREVLNQQAMELSGGMKRRLQVAKTFFVNTPIIFLDEATTGMDIHNKRATVAAIKEEARKGRTIVLTTHMLEEAEELCNAITILNHGKIIAGGTTGEVKKMGLQIFYLRLKFVEISKQLEEALKHLHPMKMEISNSAITMTVREHSAALQALSLSQTHGSLTDFEISTASLEDVFLQLIDGKKASVQP